MSADDREPEEREPDQPGYDTIRIDTEGGVAVLRLNRPDKRNALSSALRREVVEALDRLEEDDDIRAVIVTGEGDEAFAAGADVKEFSERTGAEQRESMEGRSIFDAVAAFPKPILAAIHGYCLGGGSELALACDVRIADRTARFGQPEVRIGLIPGGGGTQRLASLVGYGQALRICLTGDFVDAEEAYRIGLVEFLVDEGDHLEKAREVAGRMMRWSPVALQLIKQAVRSAPDVSLTGGLELERELFLTAFESEDGQEGISAFVEKRDPDITGK
ncbi:MAG: enoyl-CoA hydratase/isomerase family protein [Longimicrobiales bacterium]